MMLKEEKEKNKDLMYYQINDSAFLHDYFKKNTLKKTLER
jgi:hypothetical protein